MRKISAAILAGGKATRYDGESKGNLLCPNGQTVIENLLIEIEKAGIKDVVILANDPAPYTRYGKQIIADKRQDMGPLAGMEAALMEMDAEAILFLPADLPAMTAVEIKVLCAAFQKNMAGITVAATDDFFVESLCVVVHNDMLSYITKALDQGEKKVRFLWEKLGAAHVVFKNAAAFININTPADFNNWQEKERDKMTDEKKTIQLNVPSALEERVLAFFKENNLVLENTEGAAVAIVNPEEEWLRCTRTEIYIGGKIPCEAAKQMAENVGIRPPVMGAFFEHLDVKIKDCKLGCF
ncbi:MAG: molybdenum cofactor guanylyltransferase [Alphaproteobacteria bacterium]